MFCCFWCTSYLELKCEWSLGQPRNGNFTQYMRYRATYAVCEGHHTQLPCSDRLWYYFSLQWSWKTFQKYPFLVSGVGHDGEIAPTEEFVRHLYGTPKEQTINHTRLQLFGKAKKGLEMLPPTRDALDRHAIRANYQTNIWLQANKEHIDVPPVVATNACKRGAVLDSILVKIPPISDAWVKLVTCSCKPKCKTSRCSCFKKNMQCPAGCDVVGCRNPIGQ